MILSKEVKAMTEHEDLMANIGNNITRMRKKREVSQKDLAKAAGVS